MPKIEEMLENKKDREASLRSSPINRIWDDLCIKITKDRNYTLLKHRNSFAIKDEERLRDCIRLKETKETLQLNAICTLNWIYTEGKIMLQRTSLSHLTKVEYRD